MENNWIQYICARCAKPFWRLDGLATLCCLCRAAEQSKLSALIRRRSQGPVDNSDIWVVGQLAVSASTGEMVAGLSRAAISSRVQTWSVSPASMAGVTRRVW